MSLFADTITSVYITEGVTSLAASTFDGLSNLRYAELPVSLTSIGKNCFRGCASSGVSSVYSLCSLGFSHSCQP